MTLAQSLHNAVTGLGASAKSAEVVSANLANLRTEGYGRRSLALSSLPPAGGVQIVGVQRASNPVLLAERRLAGASSAGADNLLTFHKTLERQLGLPGEPGALATRIADLESALASAAQSPSSEARLQTVSEALGQVAEKFRSLSDQIQSARAAADQSIDQDVKTLNDTLSRVASINRDITRMTAMGKDVSGLIDQRQVLIDQVSEIIPLREVGKDGRAVALYTMGGVTLLDGVPAVFAFTPATAVAPGASPLSGLTLNGRVVSTAETGPLAGGRLSAQFSLRDQLGPAAQADLDAVARDLVTRLEGADPSRTAGEPGLLSDQGDPFDPAFETGLAGRLHLNPLVDPRAGGAYWPLRDGLGATTPGPVGDGALLDRLASALREPLVPASGGFLPQRNSLSGLVGDLLSRVSTARLGAESARSYGASRHAALEEMEAAEGVNSDHELQLLLGIERAYSANARVIQTIDDMLDSLLRI